jgi:hypothetical protein
MAAALLTFDPALAASRRADRALTALHRTPAGEAEVAAMAALDAAEADLVVSTPTTAAGARAALELAHRIAARIEEAADDDALAGMARDLAALLEAARPWMTK